MTPFKSRLQIIQTLRQRKEQQALEKYASTIRRRQEVLGLLDQWNRRRIEHETLWRRETVSGCTAGAFQQLLGFGAVLDREGEAIQTELAKAENAVAVALDGMIHAKQQREAMDKYLARKKQAYDRQCLHEEQKMLDEMANRQVTPALSWKVTRNPIS